MILISRYSLIFLILLSTFSCTTKLAKNKIFKHGIASGDPLSDRVIIWTRISGVKSNKVKGLYELAVDEKFNQIFGSNTFSTSKEKDYTVKIDVKNLAPNTYYYYRFKIKGVVSKVGRTKTLPEAADSVRLAFVSCANLEHGKFYTYSGVASLKKIDAIVHLGDYIYEDKPLLEKGERSHFPKKELISLKDYRQRYAQYRSQISLKLAHSLHPFISVWDDHEIADNAYISGALNHQKNEGSYLLRKEAAKKAYFEWMPIRERANQEIYRSFDFGNLLRFILIDTRLAGRTFSDGNGKEDTILGRDQENWFFRKVLESKANWNLIGSQVMFSNMYLKPISNKFKFNPDIWDGYLNSKKRVLRVFDFNKIKNTHIISGDTHAAWFIKVPDFINTNSYEIGVPSVSSNNYDEIYSSDDLKDRKFKLLAQNPWIEYVNLKDNGLVLLEINRERIITKFNFYDQYGLSKFVKFSIARK